VDNRVHQSPQENLWAIQMVLNFNSNKIVGTGNIFYILSNGGTAGGHWDTWTLGQQLKAKTNLKKDKEQELGSWEAGKSYSKNLTPCFF